MQDRPSGTNTKESSTRRQLSQREALEEEYQRFLARGKDPNSDLMRELRQEILDEENWESKQTDPEYQRWLFRMGGPH